MTRARMLVDHACIAAVAAAVFFTNLGGPKLWDDDEPRNAACAREMFVRGDPIVPTFNHQWRTDKPALLYWLMMGSYAVFGANEFAARFPSALLGVGTALLVYHLGRLLFRREVGLWAGLAMATNLMFGVAARAATPDSTLIFCTTLSLLIYVWAMTAGREGAFLPNWRGIQPGNFQAALPATWKPAAAMYAAMGLAMLAKGPVGVVLPCAAIGLFLLLACVSPQSRVARPERTTLLRLSVYRLRLAIMHVWEYVTWVLRAERAMWPNVLVASVVLVALPWYLWVAIKTDGAWPRSFLLTHNLERFATPMEGHHGSIFFHVIALVICFCPWSFLLPVAIGQLVRRLRTGAPQGAAYLLLASWIAVWLGVFSLSGTKLPNYVLPIYPALAVLCGAWAADWIAVPGKRSVERWLSAGWVGFMAAGIGISVGLTWASSHLLSSEVSLGWIGLIPIVGSIVGLGLHMRRKTAAAFGSFALTSAALLAALFAVAAVPFSNRQDSLLVTRTARASDDKPDQIGLFGIGMAGVVYYADQPVHNYQRNRWAVQEFFEEHERPLLMTDAEGYEKLKGFLPPDAKIIERKPRFLKRGEMLVIGRERRENVAGRPTARHSGLTEKQVRRDGQMAGPEEFRE